ncbi:MAG: DNA adenine methylase [Victivallales bacterium]|nr:DNA adenine methylase [Victivallales bacterium]
MNNIPHLVQYQGSKRLLASQILKYMPNKIKNFIEPFCGMAALTIAIAKQRRAEHYYLNDLNAPLVNLLKEAIETPEQLYNDYNLVWNEQFSFSPDHIHHFYHIRRKFNDGDTCPANMLYLLARCVKGAVRYSSEGLFNQGMDKRRNGTKPDAIKQNAVMISSLLKGRVTYSSVDYREVLDVAQTDDIIYMDPPYQGVSNTRDCRYIAGINYDDFVSSIDDLNKRGINFLISYDGKCGDTSYGRDLPDYLECTKILLKAGKSTQATFLGESKVTYEALYISRGLSNLALQNQESFLFEEMNNGC